MQFSIPTNAWAQQCQSLKTSSFESNCAKAILHSMEPPVPVPSHALHGGAGPDGGGASAGHAPGAARVVCV